MPRALWKMDVKKKRTFNGQRFTLARGFKIPTKMTDVLRIKASYQKLGYQTRVVRVGKKHWMMGRLYVRKKRKR